MDTHTNTTTKHPKHRQTATKQKYKNTESKQRVGDKVPNKQPLHPRELATDVTSA